MTDYLSETFGQAGHLARALPEYEARAGQVKMSREIDAAIEARESTIIEAPTGVGKSLAYLVPVTHWLATQGTRLVDEREVDPDPEEGEQRPRAVIVTANIALQEQLISKDVPLLQGIIPWQFSATLLKGKGNYLCLDRFDDSLAEYALLPPKDYAERERWKEILMWSEATRTGDFSELEFELSSNQRTRLSVTADDCLGKTCPRREDCYAEKARRNVKNVDVIVTNYHLLFTHLAMQVEFGAGVLPPFDLLVLDEVHAAADIAKEFFGFKIGHGAVKYACRLLGPSKGKRKRLALDPDLQVQVLSQSEYFFEVLRQARRDPGCYPRIVEKEVVRGWLEFHQILGRVARVYLATASTTEDAAYCTELSRAQRRIRLIMGWISEAMTLDAGDAERVYFIEHDDRTGTTKLCAKPLHVDDILRTHLFESPAIRSVIGTSATIATDAQNLDFVMGELGAEKARDLVTESPFDFEKQALFVVPKMPDPKRPEFGEAVACTMVDVAQASRGRMLGLFTSYKLLRLAAERLKNALGNQYTVLVQGDGPRMKLVERFKRDVTSILLGTKSFWAGVDVPGEALSCVVIDRIPFDPPDDPIVSALSEQDKQSFTRYQIPRASIELKQGFGRLIRSTSDRGVVVCLDRRIVETPWGKKILRALPKCTFSRDLHDVEMFLGGMP